MKMKDQKKYRARIKRNFPKKGVQVKEEHIKPTITRKPKSGNGEGKKKEEKEKVSTTPLFLVRFLHYNSRLQVGGDYTLLADAPGIDYLKGILGGKLEDVNRATEADISGAKNCPPLLTGGVTLKVVKSSVYVMGKGGLHLPVSTSSASSIPSQRRTLKEREIKEVGGEEKREKKGVNGVSSAVKDIVDKLKGVEDTSSPIARKLRKQLRSQGFSIRDFK